MKQELGRWIRSLVGIALAAALPILVFAVIATWVIVDSRRDEIEQRYGATARALLSAVETALLAQEAAVEGLAEAASGDPADLERIRAAAVTVAAGRRGAFLAALISNPDGADAQVVFEAVPDLGEALADPAAIAAAAASGRASQVGSVVPPHPGGPPPFLPTRAAVFSAEHRLLKMLSVAIAPAYYAEIIARQPVPADLLITIYDRDLRIVARSEDPGLVGRPAATSVADHVRSGRSGLFLNITNSGERYLRVIETSPVSGWRIAVGGREEAFYREVLGTLREIAVAGLLALLAAGLGTLLLARRFGRRLVVAERRGAQALRASEQRYRAASAASGQIHWSLKPDGVLPEEDSPTWRDYTGQTAEEFMRPGGWLQPIHPDDRERVISAWRQALAAGKPFETEYRLRHAGGTFRWMLARGTPVIGDDGRAAGWIGMTLDIDARKQAEERQALLMREVDHRAKNVLTVVLAMVQMTRAATIGAFVDALSGRIAALARAHTLLAESHWSGARLRPLIASELAPFDAEAAQVRIEGPDISVVPEAVQPLAMLVHELATNAAKYGSLSKVGGRVEVTWTLDPADGRLVLTWVESGGPPVTPPAETGFGSRLLRDVAARQLEADVGLDWRPEGLRFTLILGPRSILRRDAAGGPAGAAEPARTPRWAPRSAAQVLIVEDEGLVALSLERLLTAHGYGVIGPAMSTAEAERLIAEGGVDAAVLDVNIGGTSILPLAEELVLAGKPVVFYTGYGHADDLVARFPGAPIVSKPAGEPAIIEALRAAIARRAPAPA